MGSLTIPGTKTRIVPKKKTAMWAGTTVATWLLLPSLLYLVLPGWGILLARNPLIRVPATLATSAIASKALK